MALKIFFTADVHLGMKFAGYPPHIQSALTGARINTLSNCVTVANERGCNLFVIVGDLFDKKKVSQSEVIKAAQILKGFEGQLLTVLPGNHDFISSTQSDLWKRFQENSGDNVLVITEKQVCELYHYDINANIYAGPCDAKHSDSNRIDWVKDITKDGDVLFHIGVAHGTLEGLAADIEGNYYPMKQSELLGGGLDLWLLGHIHKPYPEKAGPGDRIFYSGVPEPDGFNCNHEGKAWLIEIDEDKNIKSELLSVGTYRFLREEAELHTLEDFKRLQNRYTLRDYSKYLIKLKLAGRLPGEAYEELPSFIKSIENEFFYFVMEKDNLTEHITVKAIDAEFTQGSFPHHLLTTLQKDSDPEALQIAYDLIREVKR